MERAALIAETTRPMTGELGVGALAQRVARRGFAVAADLVGPGDAEDMVQEALVRVIERRAAIRDPEAWFFRVLVRLCLRHLRRRRIVGLFRGLLGLEEQPAAVALADETPGADEDLARRRELRVALATLAALPDRQRAALLLRYGHGLPVAEVAAILGVGEGTIKTHLVRGLHRLREAREGSTP